MRQFTENFTFFYVNWWITDPEVDSCPALCSGVQRTAWFDRGYNFMRHTTEAGLLFFPLVRPMMRCIMAGMDRRTVMHLAVAVHAGFAGVFAPRAVLSSRLARP